MKINKKEIVKYVFSAVVGILGGVATFKTLNERSNDVEIVEVFGMDDLDEDEVRPDDK